jgi:predicted N-formylglutamate amidohydrolase
LLVDCNRGETSPTLFSSFAQRLDPRLRTELFEQVYRPYRSEVALEVQRAAVAGDSVLHLSVHSFTPVLHGVRRPTDVGLLFDPARPREAHFCERWQAEILSRAPSLRVHPNRPYSGADDGLTTTLRGRLPRTSYLGIELEVNQRFPRAGGSRWSALQRTLVDSVVATLAAT